MMRPWTMCVLGVIAVMTSCAVQTDLLDGRPAPPQEAPVETGRTAVDVVSSGGVASSGKYRLVFTLGQSTQNQGAMSSQQHRLQGGLIGSNGGAP